MVETTRQILGESEPEALPQELEDDILEQRARYYKRDEKGRFAGGGGGKSIRRKRDGYGGLTVHSKQSIKDRG